MPFYALGSRLRWAGVEPERLAWPVVSVGNLSAGGTGKTPFVVALARLLREQGVYVDVLSRGYGRRSRGAAWVNPAGTAEEFGDEPLMMARAGIPVFVGARRIEAGRLAEGRGVNAGPSAALRSAQDDKSNEMRILRFAQDDHSAFPKFTGVHLLDDGFQHRQLYRDVDVVLVNSEDLGDWLLPAGNLREGLGALARATAFAVPVEDEAAMARLRALGLRQPVWQFRREMESPQVDGPVYAFCGIARPGQFFAGLERGGLQLAGRKVFPDHAAYREMDIRVLAQFADRMGARALVTTEKDRARMGELVKHFGEIPLLTVGLRVVLEDEAGAMAFLRRRLLS